MVGKEGFYASVKEHLDTLILPFWLNLQDKEKGGYYGFLDYDLNLQKDAPKGCILNSRIMWTFANAYMLEKDEALLNASTHAFEFLKNYCLDKKNGGIYWQMNADGTVNDSTKHTYNQAFAIYALSSYFDVTGNKEALDLALGLFEIIESKCKDATGYLEAFDAEFKPVDNTKLSENGVLAYHTMNTLLHVLEAYTELLRVLKKHEPQNVKALLVKANLEYMIELVETKVYNPKLRRQEVFFDSNWDTLIDLHSYGHDIETAWLMDRALEVMGDEYLIMRIRPLLITLSREIYDVAYKDHSLLNECDRGKVDTTRVWWVQAEAVVGFLNAYEKTLDGIYLDAALDIYNYILEKMVDKRQGSEWYWSVDNDGNPIQKPIVEPWKCPYHNGRMCFEVLNRLEHLKLNK